MRMVAVLAGFVQSQTPSPCLSALAWRGLVVAVCSSAPATASSCVYFSAEVHGYPRLPFPPQGARARRLAEDGGSRLRGRGLRLRGEFDARDPRDCVRSVA